MFQLYSCLLFALFNIDVKLNFYLQFQDDARNKLIAAINKKSQKTLKRARENFEKSLDVDEEKRNEEKDLLDRADTHENYLDIRDRMLIYTLILLVLYYK